MAVAAGIVEIVGCGTSIPERLQFQHRQVEVAAVERHQRSLEALHALPELAHDLLFAVVRGAQCLHARQHPVAVHVADGNRDRHMAREGEEVAPPTASREQLLAHPPVRFLLADRLVAEERSAQKLLVDPRLDVEYRVPHARRTSQSRTQTGRPSSASRA